VETILLTSGCGIVACVVQTPMSPVYPQMLEQIQQLSVNGGGGGLPAVAPVNGNSPVLAPHNGLFTGLDDFATR